MRSKRIISLLLCLLIAVFQSGCFVLIPSAPSPAGDDNDTKYSGFSRIDESLVDFSVKGFDKIRNRQNYDSLDTDELRRCYEVMGEEIYYIADKKSENGYAVHTITLKNTELKIGEIRAAMTAFLCDNPQIFWVDSRFEYLVYGGETRIYLYSPIDIDMITAEAGRLRAAVESVMSAVTEDMSKYDMELCLHDEIIDMCVYDDTIDLDSMNYRVSSVLGPLVDGSAICEGYTRAFQLLLSVVGIESNCVYGLGKEEFHMWNSVKLGDQWYYTDVTWDDGDNGKTYAYFNLSSDILTESHTVNHGYRDMTQEAMDGDEIPDPFNVTEYQCTDSSMNYYKCSATRITGYDYENILNIESAIADAIKDCNGSRAVVYLYVSEDELDFDSAVNNLFYGGDYLIFDCIDDVNSMFDGVTIESSKVSLITVDKLCGINLFLNLEYVE